MEGRPKTYRGWRRELKPWQRFHLKLMLAYGGAAALLLGLFSAWSYQQQAETETEALRMRMEVLAAALPLIVDGEAVFGLEGQQAEDYWGAVGERLSVLAEQDRDIGDIYFMRVTEQPGHFEILTDQPTVEDGELRSASPFLLPYDGTRFPTMLEGLERVSVEEEPAWDEWGLTISAYAPVHDVDGEAVAIAGVDVYARNLDRIQRDALATTALALLLGLSSLGLVSIWVGRQIVQPLGEMVDASGAIASGDLDVRIRPTRQDEFGVLGRYFDRMAAGLRDRELLRSTFGRYVSPRVAEAVLKDTEIRMGGELREATILFSDLAGYSSIAERASPQEIVRLLNGYLEAMNEVLDAHDGVVIEFLGDGILAVFNAPAWTADHPAQAVSAALAMNARLTELNRKWKEEGLARLWQEVGIDELTARIGIHTGQVVAGNLGSERRLKYAVIGDNVNVAARLEQLNKEMGTSILISEAVRAELPPGFVTRSMGKVRIKGRGELLEVHAVEAAPGSRPHTDEPKPR